MSNWLDKEVQKYLSEKHSSPSDTPLARLAKDAYGKTHKLADYVQQASCMWNTPVSFNTLLLGIGYPKLSPSSSITNKAYAFLMQSLDGQKKIEAPQRGLSVIFYGNQI